MKDRREFLSTGGRMVVGTPPVSTGEPLVTIAKIEQKP